jgi:polysaccharide pyruvyl transferase WcaK-like protein
MKIQIDGTNTLNKGAELMLYATLEKIEEKHPNSTVIFNSNSAFVSGIDTNLDLRPRIPLMLWKFPKAVLTRLRLPNNFRYFSVHNPTDVDLVLDAGGFQFSDQWNHSDLFLSRLDYYYGKLKENGTKIILLPQACGPFKTPAGQKCANILNKHADLIIAREESSYQYLLDAGVSKSRIWLRPDFTISAKGTLPSNYDFIKGKVCIIPNKKMLTHSAITEDAYLKFMVKCIDSIKSAGFSAFLLNHEGKGDLALCNKINNVLGQNLPVITGLNAKEIKGVIGQSYLVISSRFHGVASALNQGIPCLATSWSHKYALLFKDFEQNDCILDVSDLNNDCKDKIASLLEPRRHKEVRSILDTKSKEIKQIVNDMWNDIWKFIS